MRNKKLCMLVLGYLGGVAIALRFKEKESSEKPQGTTLERLFADFLAVHRNLFGFLNTHVLSEENMKIVDEYKKKAFDEVELFKKEAAEKLSELKKKGVQKKDEIEEEIREIYEKRQEYFEKAKHASHEFAGETMAKSKEYLSDGRQRLDKAFENIKKKLK